MVAKHKKLTVFNFTNIFHTGGIYLDLDSLALNSFDTLRNYSAAQGAPYTYSLANGVIIGASGQFISLASVPELLQL